MLAAIIGSEAFFEPEIFTSPFSLFPPFIIILAIFYHLLNLSYLYILCYILCFLLLKSENGTRVFR